MEYRESYQGRDIRITTTRDAGSWRYAAELLDSPGESLKGGVAATEEAAHRAALSAAAAAIDRSRQHIGKP